MVENKTIIVSNDWTENAAAAFADLGELWEFGAEYWDFVTITACGLGSYIMYALMPADSELCRVLDALPALQLWSLDVTSPQSSPQRAQSVTHMRTRQRSCCLYM